MTKDEARKEAKMTPSNLTKENSALEKAIEIVLNKNGQCFGLKKEQLINLTTAIASAIDKSTKENGELKKELAALRAEVETLHGELCYICRPEDKLASEEGCSDCDERAGLHHEIDLLRQERDAYRWILEEVWREGVCAGKLKDEVAQVLAAYPKKDVSDGKN